MIPFHVSGLKKDPTTAKTNQNNPKKQLFSPETEGFHSCLELMFVDFGCRPGGPFWTSKIDRSSSTSKMGNLYSGKASKKVSFQESRKMCVPPPPPGIRDYDNFTKFSIYSVRKAISKNHVFAHILSSKMEFSVVFAVSGRLLRILCFFEIQSEKSLSENHRFRGIFPLGWLRPAIGAWWCCCWRW